MIDKIIDFSLKHRLLTIFFVGLGTFNAVTTWIEQIIQPRGFSIVQAGDTGAMLIAGGILGALVIPLLSDHLRRRKTFLILGVSGAILGLAGVTYATSYGLLVLAAFGLGFFLLSAGPLVGTMAPASARMTAGSRS